MKASQQTLLPIDSHVMKRVRQIAQENMVTPRQLAMLLLQDGLSRIAKDGAVIGDARFTMPKDNIIHLIDHVA